MALTITRLDLPAALKAELDRLARRSGESTHAIIVRALQEYVDEAMRRRGFLNDAQRANAAMLASGECFDAADVHEYILAKARGEKAVRPSPMKRRK